jgi:hypothetical protein
MTFLHSRYNSRINFSPKEIFDISEAINRDFFPSLDTELLDSSDRYQLSSSELCDISEEISREFAPKPATDVNELVLLPIDLEHLHAYWTQQDKPLNAPSSESEAALTLRVYAAMENNIHPTQFDVAITQHQLKQTLSLPPRNTAITYSAVLGQQHSDTPLAALTHSNSLNVAHSKATAQTPIASQALKPMPQPTSYADPYRYLVKNASGQSSRPASA